MTAASLLLVLFKATLLSFSGFGSLPLLRDELVVERRVLTDDDLNRAIAVARVTPGPMGSYVVAVGYAVAGTPGAAMGWIALSAPALLVLPIGAALHRRRQSVRWQGAIEATILASAALVFATARSMVPAAVVDAPTGAVAAGALLLVLVTRTPGVVVVFAGAAITWLWPG